MKKKRILVISDTHCGHIAGLTPKAWQFKNDVEDSKMNKFGKIQSEIWDWYIKTVKSLGQIDILFHLGDAIDGNGFKSGGTELITTDRLEQCDIAVECIKQIKAKEIFICYGTGYHVGDDEDFEKIVSDNTGAKIGSHHWVSVYGKVFDLKHKVNSSGMPHTRSSPIMREQLWNMIWAEKQLQPKSDIMLRGHVHYDSFVGNSDFLGITLPSLQWSTKYGTRACSGLVSIGLTVFDVYEDGTYDWSFKIAKLPVQKTDVVIVK